MNYVERYKAGTVEAGDIDDWIDFWHSSKDMSRSVHLHTWLGFTFEEWSQYVGNCKSLKELFDE